MDKTMYVNLRYEGEGEFKTCSLDLSTTTPELLGYFTSHGWVIIDYSNERRG